MAEKRARYVIAYDIPQDKRRTKMAHTLEGHGERVQYSVFECQLTRAQFEKLWKELQKLMEPDEDSLRAYHQCPECAAWVKTAGQAQWVKTAGQAQRIDEVPEVFIV